LKGEWLGVASIIRDFVVGESLLKPMLAGEAWAEQLYLDSVCALQAISEADLGQVIHRMERETANLEFFDTWHWVLLSGKSFVHHTVESLEAHILDWLG
jgi:hypothetical protein